MNSLVHRLLVSVMTDDNSFVGFILVIVFNYKNLLLILPAIYLLLSLDYSLNCYLISFNAHN